MDDDVAGHLDQAEHAARDISDPSTRDAVNQLIAALRASSSSADYRSAGLE